jgi:hypothetical protein
MSTMSRSPGSAPSTATGQLVHDREIDVAHVVGGIVVGDLPVEPFPALDPEFRSRLDRGDRRDIRMPAIVS